jgi:hypothetical protein
VRKFGSMQPNQITGANAGKRLGFAGRSRVVLSHRPGVAQFHRSANSNNIYDIS